MSTKFVPFECPKCKKRMKSLAANTGRLCRCLGCPTWLVVPGQKRAPAVIPVARRVDTPAPVAVPVPQKQALAGPLARRVAKPVPVAAPVPQPQAVIPVAQRLEPPTPVVVVVPPKEETVPLKVALPNNLGGVETTVSQGTVNSVVKFAAGGLMALLGVAVAGYFGVQRPSA